MTLSRSNQKQFQTVPGILRSISSHYRTLTLQLKGILCQRNSKVLGKIEFTLSQYDCRKKKLWKVQLQLPKWMEKGGSQQQQQRGPPATEAELQQLQLRGRHPVLLHAGCRGQNRPGNISSSVTFVERFLATKATIITRQLLGQGLDPGLQLHAHGTLRGSKPSHGWTNKAMIADAASSSMDCFQKDH